VNADAYVAFSIGGRRVQAFIEYERRPPRPESLRRKLAPYLDYYDCRQAFEDFGAWPELWIVPHDEVAGAQLTRVTLALQSAPARANPRVRIAALAEIGQLLFPRQILVARLLDGPRGPGAGPALAGLARR